MPPSDPPQAVLAPDFRCWPGYQGVCSRSRRGHQFWSDLHLYKAGFCRKRCYSSVGERAKLQLSDDLAASERGASVCREAVSC